LIELRLRGRRTATLAHELIELLLVPRHAQARKEFLEFALLIFEAAQRFGAVIVKRTVTARPRRLPPGSATLPGRHPTLPLAHATMLPATHPPAPNNEGQGGKTYRPPEREAENHQGDPGWFSQLVNLSNYGHFGLVV
jgi:hypothetical protein